MGSTFLSMVITQWGIPKLRTLKCNQIIREEGPESHHKKSGTPTMGGLLIVPVALILGNLISLNGQSNQQIISISLITFAYMVIGGIDDLRSLRFKTNTGLSPKGKILLQAAAGILFLIWTGWQGWINSEIPFAFDKSLDIGVMIWPLALFVFLAESNAANLTDGLDGLASGCGSLIFTGLAIQLMLRGNEGDPALAGFSIAMAGSWLGFLTHNRNPAKIFMGDTGSLAMGAALSGIALLSNSLWPLFIMGGVLLAESLSVIVQVWFFKITKKLTGKGKRILLMAPLHHHYEVAGASEPEIVQKFWLTTFGLVILGLIMHPSN